MTETETHVGALASEALKLSLSYKMTAECHRAKQPAEKYRAAEDGNDRFLGQVGIQVKMLRLLPQSSPLVNYNSKKIHQLELQNH